MDGQGFDSADHFRVPRALDCNGIQVRPRLGIPPENLRCPICQMAVIQKVSALGHPFFAHVRDPGASCRSEPRIFCTARDLLRSVLDRARAGHLALSVRIPCPLCGVGHEVPWSLGSTTTAGEVVVMEDGLARLDGPDLTIVAGDQVLGSVVITTKHARAAIDRSLMSHPWIQFDADAVRGSLPIQAVVRGQREALTLRCVDAWNRMACTACRAREEKVKRKEDERHEAMRQHLAQMEECRQRVVATINAEAVWYIAITDRCSACRTPLVVPVHRAHFAQVRQDVADGLGQHWHVALCQEDGQVQMGMSLVNAATYDGGTEVAATTPYIVVPAALDPFQIVHGARVLATKHVALVSLRHATCLICVRQAEVQEKERLRLRAIIDDPVQGRDLMATPRENSSFLSEDERVAVQMAGQERMRQIAGNHAIRRQREQTQREENRRIAAEDVAARKANEIEGQRYARSPRGILDRISQSLHGVAATNLFAEFLDRRNQIEACVASQPDLAEVARQTRERLHAHVRLAIAMARIDREKSRLAVEQQREQSSVDAAWEAVVVQLRMWWSSEEWTLSEEVAIGAVERAMTRHPTARCPGAELLIDQRRRRLRPITIRAAVLPNG